jgi:hypothetical protein
LSWISLLFIALAGFAAWKFFGRSKSRAEPVSDEMPIAVSIEISNEDQEKDAWEGWFFEEAADPKPVEARLKISYIDGEGRLTERIINVIEFDNAPSNSKSGLIIARCELRAARRTFRFDRIHKAIDLDTGELIQDVQDFLRQAWMKSPKRSLVEFEEQFYGPLEVLLFIARADGRLISKEREIIVNFCRKHLSDQRISDEDLTKSIKAVDKLSLQSFKLSVGRLLQGNRELIADVIEAAEAIIATEKSVHPSELEAVEYLKRRNSVGKASSN